MRQDTDLSQNQKGMVMKMASNAKMLSNTELAAFCSQIAMILKAGVSVQEGISIMEEDSRDKDGVKSGGTEILTVVREHAELGEPFRNSLEAAGVFPKYMLDMATIGEQSGRLDEVMESLAVYYERNEAISKSLRSAITYPALMIVMMLVVIGVLIVKVLPIFNQVFSQLGTGLSSFSMGIMQFGNMLNRYAAVILAVAAVIILVLALLRLSKKGARWYAGLFRNFVGTRKLAGKIAAGRFASAMALMMSSGLDVDQSLGMTKELVDDEKIRAKIDFCLEKIDGGDSFSNALEQAEIFSGIYTRMVLVGFKTGSVDEVMRKIADRYEVEVDDQISSIISILEPSLVAVLSLIVGMVLLSVMMPLMGIMTSIG